MYRGFYGLKDEPFGLGPDPKFLFRTESQLEVLANLEYGIERGKGLIVITGEAGTGKTTLLRFKLQNLDRSVLAAYIFNPLLSTDEFFNMLAGELRLRPRSSKAENLRLLGTEIMSRRSLGQTTVLVIDEAHLIPPHLFEEIRLLLNFETNQQKLIQIVLCGQPELREILMQPELRQFKQRIALRSSIRPLAPREVSAYITWRLRVAGAKQVSLFDPDAVELIYRFSGGIPRIVNNICDNALLTAFSRSLPRITPNIITEVAEILDLVPIEIDSAQSPLSRLAVSANPDVTGLYTTGAVRTGRPDPSTTEEANVRYLRPEESRPREHSEYRNEAKQGGARTGPENPQGASFAPRRFTSGRTAANR